LARRYDPRVRKLVFVIVAAMAPAALLTIVLIGYDYYDRERTRLIRDSLGTARALSAAVDSEHSVVKAALFALATSPHLAAGNLRAFHAQALAAMKDQTFVNVILADVGGRQLLNTFRPFGEPLPTQGDPGGMLRVFQTDAPLVTDLFKGRLTQTHIIGVAVPVRIDGKVRYGLNAGLAPEKLSAFLVQQKLPPGWIAVVLDGTGTIVARTHDAQRLIGQKASPELLRGSQGKLREDAFDARTVEGIAVLTVFSRSPVSGWTVAIGIPQRELMASLLSSMARLFMVGFIAFASALGLAFAIGRRFLPAA
jgi:hypothetical protein